MFRRHFLGLASKTSITRTSLLAKRFYAETVNSTSNVLKLQFALPHETLYSNTEVKQVNLPAKSGQIGILANHIPTVEQLNSGVVEIFESTNNSTKKYFIPGGFATMQPNSTLCITAVEAFPLDSFSEANVKSLLQEAKKNINSNDPKLASENTIKVELLENLLQSISKST
ncbi:F1F0 ATP synthase subunit delta NDAI_0A08200 [Naumovozyma dairenensis CBS 421]|uniref:ATP synthase subunit delta, mitochondrial n=1 Tax=Naumovozyma dairenensis (strain ATCC 10597 / BCRC 20456 / CBS 421 / NBRC 0211 / NRRL Y-12639) TaxID=1071378 RepID=G0W586_NAUDC|nr:hypothetical protein NDAI_0A08200 [Naumovozyma dairenensis CBS 421]CCD22974.1 hypothetical protein NDAI_0A08200 [Naumovozyma dairenensis CBS 421]